MNRLTIHFKIQNITFAHFIAALPMFRAGLKNLSPPASVCINISPKNVIDGDLVIADIPLHNVQTTLDNVRSYFHDILPDVQTAFSYVDWEQRS